VNPAGDMSVAPANLAVEQTAGSHPLAAAFGANVDSSQRPVEEISGQA
jgi:hypothetical protein